MKTSYTYLKNSLKNLGFSICYLVVEREPVVENPTILWSDNPTDYPISNFHAYYPSDVQD